MVIMITFVVLYLNLFYGMVDQLHLVNLNLNNLFVVTYHFLLIHMYTYYKSSNVRRGFTRIRLALRRFVILKPPPR